MHRKKIVTSRLGFVSVVMTTLFFLGLTAMNYASEFPDPDIFDGGKPTENQSASDPSKTPNSQDTSQQKSQEPSKSDEKKNSVTATTKTKSQDKETVSGGGSESGTETKTSAGKGISEKIIAAGAFQTGDAPPRKRTFASVKTAGASAERIEVTRKYEAATSSETARQRAEEQLNSVRQQVRTSNQGSETGEAIPSDL